MTLLLPKQQPLRSPAYLKWVREEGRCVLTGSPNPDPHHVRLGWNATGLKPPDDRILPLAHELHMKLHHTGECAFWLEQFAYSPLGERCLADALNAWAREMYGEWEG